MTRFPTFRYRAVLVLAVVAAVLPGSAGAGVRDLVRARSTPTPAVQGRLVRDSFVSSPEALRALFARSMFSPSQMAVIDRNSEFRPAQMRRLEAGYAPAALRWLNGRSEFSAAEARLLRNRSEPPGRAVERQTVSRRVGAAVDRQTRLSPAERERLRRSIGAEGFRIYLNRRSVTISTDPYSRRSTPSEAEQRMLQNRSTD